VLVPERIDGSAAVKLGDILRLSIESPKQGYLYVINREQYADGSTGTPNMIFPTLRMRGGNNSVSPGTLIDIPDGRDAQPFFTLISPRKPGQPQTVGELITVIVSPRPLEGITPARDAQALPVAQVARWEADWGSEIVELLEMNNGAGLTWTEAEKLASETTRGLTQLDPTPQTVYRVNAKRAAPVMVTLQLLYGQVTAAQQ